MKANDLILIVDMQNVYLSGQPWGCDSISRSIQNIQMLLRIAEAETNPPAVCFTRFLSDPDATGAWKDYNIKHRDINANPWLNEITDELKPYLRYFPLYTKSVYSSLRIPELHTAAERAGRLVVAGVMSECCVLATCMEAVDMGCHVVYLQDVCSGDNAAMEASALNILKGLSPLHVVIMDTPDYIGEREQ